MFTFMYDHMRTPPKAQIIALLPPPPSTEAHKALEGVWHTPFNLSAFSNRTVFEHCWMRGSLDRSDLFSKIVLSGCKALAAPVRARGSQAIDLVVNPSCGELHSPTL